MGPQTSSPWGARSCWLPDRCARGPEAPKLRGGEGLRVGSLACGASPVLAPASGRALALGGPGVLQFCVPNVPY